MPELTVAHLDFDGNTVAEFANPAGLRWTYQIGAVAPGKIQYTLAESDPGVERDGFGPKRTDFALRDGFTDLLAGFLWSVNYPLSGELINVVGHDWLQWLDQPPLSLFDYDTSIDGLVVPVDASRVVPENFVLILDENAWVSGTYTLADLIDQLLLPLMSLPAEQVVMVADYSGTAFSQTLKGYLERSANVSVLQLLQELGQMGSPFGFDFWAEPDRTLKFVGPRRTNPSSVTPVYAFTGPDDIVDGEFTNNGPLATEILFGDGVGNTKRYWHKEHQASIDQYRRWAAFVELDGGDTSTFQIGGQTEGDYKAQASQNRMMFPQRELPLTVVPEAGFGFENRVMEAVDIDYEKYAGSYHRVDSYWWITSQTYYISDEGKMAGEWLCDLTLDQINVPIS